MKLYVVIPHYIITEHVAELARKTIETFRKTSDCVIISCDDASPYDSSFLKDISDVYIRNKKNKGFAGNCNIGFNWIMNNEKEDCHIVCVNNDIEVYPEWYEEFKKSMDIGKGRMVGGLGFKVKTVEGRPIEEYKTNPGSKANGNYITEGGRIDDWVFPGGFYMTTKGFLEKVGLYDEKFEHGGYEDIDLFMRAKTMGERLIMTPKVAYWHEEGATRFSEEEKGQQSNVEPKNRAYFKEKWGYDAHENINTMFIDNRINL